MLSCFVLCVLSQPRDTALHRLYCHPGTHNLTVLLEGVTGGVVTAPCVCSLLWGRWGQKPDGVCLVVGGCARGFDPAANTTADIIYTNSNMLKPGATTASSSSSNSQQLQYFWEAFPAADGFLTPTKQSSSSSSSHGWSSDARTTYMFTYMDAQVRAQPGEEEHSSSHQGTPSICIHPCSTRQLVLFCHWSSDLPHAKSCKHMHIPVHLTMMICASYPCF